MRVTVASLAAGGDGVARLDDGRTVFVAGAAPGDELDVHLVEDHPRWARAEIAHIATPGPTRVEPPCPYVGECGGCQWQHLDYAAQVDAKAKILRDAVERLGGLEVPGPVECIASPEPLG